MNPLNALLPVFALIAVGYGLRRAGFPGPGFWSRVEQLTYYVLLPALLVRNLSTARFGELDPMPIVAAMALALLAMSVLVLALRPWLVVDGPGFSSVYQGAIRPNIYVALSGAAGLFGDAGVVLAAVVVA
ncbi:MAG: AEC family transporter, partial [Chromatiales bacterium]